MMCIQSTQRESERKHMCVVKAVHGTPKTFLFVLTYATNVYGI